MAVKIQSALDILREPPNCLLYGDNGVGKTQAYASVAEVEDWRPGLLIQFITGAKSAVNAALNTYPSGLEVATCASFAEVGEVRDMLLNKKHKFRSVCLDNGTDLNHWLISRKRKLLGDIKDHRKWYQEPAIDMRDIVRDFRQLPIPFFMLALKDEILSNPNNPDSARKIRPDFTAQMTIELPGFFDIIGYMHFKTELEGGRKVTKRVMQFHGDEWVWARDNTHSLPEFMHEPTALNIWEHIQKRIKEMEHAQG